LKRAFGLAALSGLFLLVFGFAPAVAFSLIRDAEIEATLDRISRPIFRAAALNPAIVKVYIVNDPEMNAFVAGGQNVFINSGMLLELDTIDELRSVIAHETGHIAGGHQARRGSATRGARGLAAIGMIGAAAAAVAGSPEAGLAIAAGSSQAAQRNLLAHGRGEEAAADQMALRYVAIAGGDPGAMLDVLRRFRSQELQRSLSTDPYLRSHPLWSERIALIEENVGELPSGRPPSLDDVYWHGRMIAKLKGFLRPPEETLRTYPKDMRTEPAMLARAIAYHRTPAPRRAIARIDELIEIQPEDPYYRELKGQFLLESGNAERAAAAYREAAEFAPLEPQILGGLGRALLNMNRREADLEAESVLALSVRYDKANEGVWRDLALAEARLGEEGMAALATAERYMLLGQGKDAARNASRAAQLLPKGSPGWQRAQDMLTLLRRRDER
jgi:predicted Zn-dependent protease